MAFDPASKPRGIGLRDISFAAGIRNGLLQEIGAAAGVKQVCYCPLDRGDRNAFLNCDVVCGEIALVHENALWYSPAQPSCAGNGEMNRCRICI
jgi:hypothetical protein